MHTYARKNILPWEELNSVLNAASTGASSIEIVTKRCTRQGIYRYIQHREHDKEVVRHQMCLPSLDVAGQEVDIVASCKAEAAHIAVAIEHVVIPLPSTLCMRASSHQV